MKRKNGYLTLDGFMARFDRRERAEIRANARRLAREMATFAKLRKAHKLTQVEMARRLGISQESISRLENRTDMLVSTLRSYVDAMGGDLRLVALFPGEPALEVSLGDLGESAAAKARKPPRRAPRIAAKGAAPAAKRTRRVRSAAA